MHDAYLGDGVYASFDGYHIWLDLRAQDLTTRIALEPSVLVAFDMYRKSLANLPPATAPGELGAKSEQQDRGPCSGCGRLFSAFPPRYTADGRKLCLECDFKEWKTMREAGEARAAKEEKEAE